MDTERQEEVINSGSLEVENTSAFINHEEFSCEDMLNMYEKGVEWADKHPNPDLIDLEVACAWLEEKIVNITYVGNCIEHTDIYGFIDAFREHMKR